ncbi:Uncharacterised protein [Serratia odorifera]|uniref:Uncharacterized protein n=2 Tax=Serratia odorifera TaxID=618 RepID=D4EAB7_SEROD|nr:hypothetical protein HMPREF0758_5117 [Serratia odorifera DSM 4582]PNK89323.1 hypothetical protein CEQ31_006220 [Serratia odorifera]RII70431.1 hypothetical protein DX901_20080 [Serratia odorifera]VDZ63636.1 Uncharacterised protein [Serratia odorifera]
MISPDRKNIFMLFIYMVIGSAVGIFMTVLITSLLVDVYLYIIKGVKIDIYSYDFMKLFNISFFCGLIGGGGCWAIYYRNYRRNK